MNDFMLPTDCQRANEHKYNRRTVNRYLRKHLEENYQKEIELGIKLVQSWLSEEFFPQKHERLQQLKLVNTKKLVINLLVETLYSQAPDTFVTVSSCSAKYLDYKEKLDNLKTVSELLAVLYSTDLFTIYKTGKLAPLMLQSNVELPDKLLNYIDNCAYLPPMVCKPDPVTSNSESGYLTFNESVLLNNSHHDDPVALDVLNIQNQVAMQINLEFTGSVQELPDKPLDTLEKKQNWNIFMKGSRHFYELISAQSDSLYLVNKYDKRGRMYACGYWINTIGTLYKKAMLDFKDKEYIDVPEEYRL